MTRIANVHVLMLTVARFGLRCPPVRMAMYAALGLAVICLLVAAAFWYPAHREQSQTVREIAAVRAAMVDAVRSEEVQDQQKRTMAALALYEKKLESRVDQAELIRSIARLAEKRGVHVLSQSFDTGKGGENNDGRLFIELGLQGAYPALRRLLSDFAELPVWLEIVEARMESSGDGGGQLRAQLRLMTFRAPRIVTEGRS